MEGEAGRIITEGGNDAVSHAKAAGRENEADGNRIMTWEGCGGGAARHPHTQGRKPSDLPKFKLWLLAEPGCTGARS